ncbi:MAG: cell wall hydrolase, partial [Pontixanthobacter sp.]
DGGQGAVAQVILNRVSHIAYPNSVCGVIYQGSNRRTGCQFSFTCDGSLMRPPSPAGRARARRTAERALGGAVSSAVGRSTHYHANYVVPYWSSSLIKTAVIGTHIFYRSPGRAGNDAAFRSRYAGTEPVVGAVASEPQHVLPETAPSLPTYSPQMTDPKVMDVPEDSARALDHSALLDYKFRGNQPLPLSSVEPKLESALDAAKAGTGKSVID